MKKNLKKIVDLIEDYDICIKEAEYEGNVEQKEGLAETKILLEKVLNYISKLQKELDKEKEKNKLALNYIRKEMYVDENPTICGDEDTITELPISLCLYNEELRELLNLLNKE